MLRMLTRSGFLLLAAAALAAQAQPGPTRDEAAAARSVPSRPSVPSTAAVRGAPLPVPPAPVAGVDRPRTVLLEGGSFGLGPADAGLEGALNSGTPPAYDRKSGPRKVCPPGLENRNNVCAAPMGGILSR